MLPGPEGAQDTSRDAVVTASWQGHRRLCRDEGCYGFLGAAQEGGCWCDCVGWPEPRWLLLSSSRVTVIRGKTGFSSVSESTERWALTSP